MIHLEHRSASSYLGPDPQVVVLDEGRPLGVLALDDGVEDLGRHRQRDGQAHEQEAVLPLEVTAG